MRCTIIFFAFSVKKKSLSGGEEKLFTKNKGVWRISARKNEYEMERISLHSSTYFSPHTNRLVLQRLFILLLNSPLRVYIFSFNLTPI